MTELGSAFHRPIPEQAPHVPSEAEVLSLRLLSAIEQLQAAVVMIAEPREIPAPTVVVPEIDLGDIVEAVVSIKPGPTASEIADAIAKVLRIPEPQSVSKELEDVATALKKLEFRLQGVGTQAFGGGSVNVSNIPLPVTVGNTNTNPIPVTQAITTTDRFKTPQADRTIFGDTSSAAILDDITYDFSVSGSTSNLNQTIVTTGSVSQTNSRMLLQSGTSAAGQASVQSGETVIYRPGHEIRADFTGVWSAPATGGVQHIGLFDTSNGFFIGYTDTTFGVFIRNAGVDTQTVQASFNGDTCLGQAGSQFTRGGVVEALDATKENVFRIRFGWLGAAVVLFEVMSPDGDWVLMHTIREPNLSANPSIGSPSLPLRASVRKTSGASNVTLSTSSWRAATHGPGRGGRLSPGNSSTVALGSSATFTGVFVDVTEFVSVPIHVTADQFGTLYVDHSADSVTTVGSPESFPVSAGQQLFVVITPQNRFLRVRYVNGGTAQGSFNLQTVLKSSAVTGELLRLDTDITDASVALLGREVLAGKEPGGGSYADITRTVTNASNQTGEHVGIVKHEVDTPIKALTTWVTGQATIASTTTAVNVIPAPTTGRKTFAVKALSSNTKTVFIGPSSGVTTGSGWELAAGEAFIVEVDPTSSVWVIGTTATSQSLAFAEVV